MADDRTIRTTIELSGEGSYANKLKQIENSLKQVNSVQRVVSAQYGKDDRSLAALTARQSVLQDKLDLQRRKLEAIREEYDRTVEAQGESSEAAQRLARDFNSASAQMFRTERDLQGIEEELSQMANAAEETGNAAENAADNIGDLSQAARDSQANMDRATSATNSYRDALNSAKEAAEKLADKAGTAMGAAAAGVATVSVKEFMGFEQEMSKVETLADQSVKSMSELSAEALEASNASGVAARDIASAAYDALSSGVDTANVMDYMTKAAKAAKAGQAELGDTVNGSTSIMNAWKIAYSDAGDVFNKLLVAQDKGKTTLGEISQSIGQITGIAPQLNISLEETLAATAALTKNGVQTSSAITGLRAVMSNVLKPTAEAAEEAQRLGIEFNAAALQSKGLTGFLADIVDKTEGSSDSLAKLFGSVEGLSQIMLLGGTAAADYEDALSAMASSGGRLDQAFNTTTANRADQLAMALNRLKNNAIEFGGSLAPYIDMASDSIDKLSDTLSGMTAEQMKNTFQTGLFIAGALKIVGSMSKITAAARTTAALFSGPAGWIGLGVAGITTLIGVLGRAESASEKAEKAMAGLFEPKDQDRVNRFNLAYEAQVNASVTKTGDISTEIANIYDEIATALTDGLPDTEDITAGLEENVRAVYGGAIDEVEGWVNDEIAKLDVDSETYETDVANIKSKGKEMADALEAQQMETLLFISEMSGKSTAEVQEQLGRLGDIEAAVQETIAEIERARQLEKEQGKQASNIVKSGGATNEETVGRAFGYEQTEYKSNIAKIEAQYQKDKLALEAKYDELGKGEYQKQSKELESKYTTDTAAALTAYQTSVSELLAGLGTTFAESNPEMAEQMKTAVADMDMAAQIQAALEDGMVTSDEVTQGMRDKYKELLLGPLQDAELISMDDQATLQGRLGGLAGALMENARTAFDNADTGFIGEAIGAAFQQGAFEGIEGVDLSTTEGQLQAMLQTVGENGGKGMEKGLSSTSGSVSAASSDLGTDAARAAKLTLRENSPSKVMYDIGANAGQGLANGINSKYSAVYSAAKRLAAAATAGARITLQIHSPSKVFERLGEYTGEGMIKGVNSKVNAVQRAMKNMVNPAGITAQGAEYGAPGRSGSAYGSSTVNNINVRYSGAFTRTEARRFGAALNNQMAAEAAARGY